MNANRKAAALKNYRPIFEQMDDTIIEALKAGKENYTNEEIAEILEALGEDQYDAPDATEVEKPVHFQEWEVKIDKKVAEKLKISRPCVKISDEEAETLNAGILDGPNTYAKMYFKPE